MTDIREQLRAVIRRGIEGWLDVQFRGNRAPVDAITGHPLTRDTATIYYNPPYRQRTMEGEFLLLCYIDESKADTILTPDQVQTWINYHWQHAQVELAEYFGDLSLPVTSDEAARRQSIRDTMLGQGWRRIL